MSNATNSSFCDSLVTVGRRSRTFVELMPANDRPGTLLISLIDPRDGLDILRGTVLATVYDDEKAGTWGYKLGQTTIYTADAKTTGSDIRAQVQKILSAAAAVRAAKRLGVIVHASSEKA